MVNSTRVKGGPYEDMGIIFNNIDVNDDQGIDGGRCPIPSRNSRKRYEGGVINEFGELNMCLFAEVRSFVVIGNRSTHIARICHWRHASGIRNPI